MLWREEICSAFNLGTWMLVTENRMFLIFTNLFAKTKTVTFIINFLKIKPNEF